VGAQQPPEHADGRLKGVDVLVLVVRQAAVQPLAGLGQRFSQVHDHHGVEAVDDDPSEAMGAHLRALGCEGVVSILAWRMR
jgi:hypothetical protein